MFITYVVEDLNICTRPTCRSILCDGIRKKVPTGSFFFIEFTNCIYISPPQKMYLEVCHIGSDFFFCESHRLEYRNR